MHILGIKATTLTTALLYIIFVSCANPSNAQTHNASDISAIGPESFEVLRQFYDYDKGVPLDATITGQIEGNGYVREKIIFRGHRSQVPGYLAIPQDGNAPFPVVLLLHGVTSSKESWWEENNTMERLTKQLLASGYAVLTLDSEYHGERSGNSEFKSPIDFLEKGWFVQFRDMTIQSVIDYRRGLDYLATRADIDMSRVGMVGYSMGGMMTFILSAVDERISLAVSCVSPIVTVPYLPTAVQNFAPFIRDTPFLMLMATSDERNYSRETANQVFNLLASENKRLEFFESGHMLPKEWPGHAIKWIETHLR